MLANHDKLLPLWGTLWRGLRNLKDSL